MPFQIRLIGWFALLLFLLTTNSVEAQIYKNRDQLVSSTRTVRPLFPLTQEKPISVNRRPIMLQQQITLSPINLDDIPTYDVPADDEPEQWRQQPVAIAEPNLIPPPPQPQPYIAPPIINYDPDIVQQIKDGIASQRSAGYRDYNPTRAYVVDPSKQRMSIVNLTNWSDELTIPVGTGKNGIGFGSAQTPTGFFTMGGVRIAKDSSAYIQTGDSKTGVSGVYAEMLYPPSYYKSRLRGRVPNNVIIHGFNPSVSRMLKDRHEKNMIGRIPCTTGCPVPAMHDLPKLSPYLKASAGSFDPGANPNSNLRTLIRKGKVTEYQNRNRLGDPILILKRSFN